MKDQHRLDAESDRLRIRDVACLVDDGTGRTVTRRHQTVSMEGGRIAWIGDADACPGTASATDIEARGGLCLPGLVNSHAHSPLSIVRGMVEDLGFAPAYTPGVPQGHWLSDEQTHRLARLGQLEMLMAGATTIVDYYARPEPLARAAEELGVRAVLGGRIMDVDTAELAMGRFRRDAALGRRTLEEAVDLVEQHEGRGRIRTLLAPHAPDTCSRELLVEIVALAGTLSRDAPLQIHTHLAQSSLEVLHVREREGMSPVELLEETGVLSASLVAAHCIFLDEDDISRLGRHGTIVAHAPIGNAAAGNAAPILALRRAGARITLCTDSKSADLFEAMRMAIATARWKAGGEFVLDAATVFDWATREAARALPAAGASSALAVGQPADLVVLDPDAPGLRPLQDGIGMIVHSGCGANVRHVVCDGEVLVRDARPVRVDLREVVDSAQEVADELWKRARTQ